MSHSNTPPVRNRGPLTARSSSLRCVSPADHQAALETERRCFIKVILESNVTPNITKSSDSFCTVPPIVNGGDWECIVRDLETIIVLVLLALNFIPQRSHHSLTLPRSRIRDSANATLSSLRIKNFALNNIKV